MKGFRSTWIMAALVTLLAAYTYYEFKNSAEDGDESKGERPAFQVKREDVREINLKSQGVEVIIKKMGDIWQMEKPVKDLAEASAVEGYLFGLLGEKLKSFHSEKEDGKVDWAAFGLDNPATRIELNGEHVRQHMEVSSKNAFDGSFYIRQDDQIFLGDRNLAQLTGRSPQSFRSRKLWRLNDAQIERVEIQGEKNHFSLVKEKDNWALAPMPAFAISPAKVAAFVSDLEQLTALDVVKDDISEQDQSDYLLKKPSLKFQVSFKGQDNSEGQWNLTVGQDKGMDVFLFNDQRPTIYKTAKSAADRLRVSPLYFRDGKAPFAFNVEKASLVSVRGPKMQHVFKKEDGGWVLTDPSSDKDKLELDQDKLIELVQSLHNLEASDFVSGLGVDLKRPPQIEVKDSDGKTLLALSWGDEFKGKNPWSSGSTMRYTKTNLSKEVMGVTKDKLDKLIDAGLVRQKHSEKKADGPEKK